jgi:hypothetical protein
VHEKVGRETLKVGKESLSGQHIPIITGVLDPKIKNKHHCCAICPRLFAGKVCTKRWAGKHSKYGRIAGKCAPPVSFTGGRGRASVRLGGLKRALLLVRARPKLPDRLKRALPCWSGCAQSCLIDCKGRGPVGQGVPKVALLIEKGALVRARPELPDRLKRACPC